MKLIEEPENGLDLDNLDDIELPELVPLEPPGTPFSSQGAAPTEDTGETGGLFKSISKFQMIIIGSGLALVIILLVFWQQRIIRIPFLTGTERENVSETYASVGPITTNVGDAGHIRMTLEINCKDLRLKEKVSQMDPVIKNRIFMVLNTARAQQMIEKRDFDALRPYLKKEINEILRGASIEDVYFSKIITY